MKRNIDPGSVTHDFNVVLFEDRINFGTLYLLVEVKNLNVREDVGIHEQQEKHSSGEEQQGRDYQSPDHRLCPPHGVHQHRVHHPEKLQSHPGWRPDRL